MLDSARRTKPESSSPGRLMTTEAECSSLLQQCYETGAWNKFIRSHNLPVQVVSYDELAQDKRLNPLSGSKNVLWHEPNDYAMVVIDEAHNLRNPSTQRASAVRALLEEAPSKRRRIPGLQLRSTTVCGISTISSNTLSGQMRHSLT